jgi:sterol desaturase/sphingolipid hydroxylase (fatty acid hydroxylase superfamily)
MNKPIDKATISRKDESIRLFKNPVLEYFSHIHPRVPFIVYLPILFWCLYSGLAAHSVVAVLLSALVGLLFWTLTEYIMHRFVFHYHPRLEWGKNISFLMHGIHHQYPKDSTRLVMPLLISVPLAVVFYILFAFISPEYGRSAYVGFLIGYLSYDGLHFAIHHFAMRGPILSFIRAYHLKHHFQNEHKGYGVSNPLWDVVFKTYL